MLLLLLLLPLFPRFVEWVAAPSLGAPLPSPVVGKKVSSVRSSKFCTGRHLEFYRDALLLLDRVGSSVLCLRYMLMTML